MALRPCKECKREISSDAKACPNCGKKQRAETGLGMGCLVLIGIVVIFGLIGSLGEHKSETSLSPAEQVAKQKEEAAFSRAVRGAKALHESMRNPDSFKLSQALLMPDGTVCYQYRAQNGFGGVNVGHAALTPSGQFRSNEMEGFRALWNKLCANKSGTDKTWEVGYAAGLHGAFSDK